jgi:soluble lytic murein transglycosylase-like protein
MSTEAIAAPAGVPADELAISQRVRQLQALIAQTGQATSEGLGATASTMPATAGSFATALQQATSAGAGASPLASQASASTGAGGGSGVYDSLIAQSASRYGIDPAVLHGLIQQESGFDPNASSSAGAQGLTQLMPGTASSLGVRNPLDPAESIEGGARYLSQMMSQFGGNTSDALAAYNAGPGAVQRYGGVPPYAETQSYVSKVLGYAEAYRRTQGAPTGTGGLA